MKNEKVVKREVEVKLDTVVESYTCDECDTVHKQEHGLSSMPDWWCHIETYYNDGYDQREEDLHLCSPECFLKHLNGYLNVDYSLTIECSGSFIRSLLSFLSRSRGILTEDQINHAAYMYSKDLPHSAKEAFIEGANYVNMYVEPIEEEKVGELYTGSEFDNLDSMDNK